MAKQNLIDNNLGVAGGVKPKATRALGLDLIRIIAFLSVISVHFFLHNDFYNLNPNNVFMYVATCFRNLFMICIPLFLMLSGYLLRDKEPNGKYYCKIARIIIEYFLAFFFCMLYDVISSKNFNFIGIIRNAFEFGYYSWYINMYIGLFCLAPFLNKIFKYTTKREQQLLILIMIGLTILPSIVNYAHWNNNYFVFKLPDFWSNSLFYLTYYMVGCYIGINKPKFKKWVLVVILILNVLIESLFSLKIFGNVNDVVPDGLFYYNTIFVFVSACAVFLLFYDISYRQGTNKKLQNLIAKISAATLSAYLISNVFDKIVYKHIAVVGLGLKQKYFLAHAAIIVIALLSLIYGIVVTEFLNKIQNKGKRKPCKLQQQSTQNS